MRRRINVGDRREVDRRNRWGSVVLAVAALALAAGLAHLFDYDQMPEHWWRTLGPGSTEYEQCYARMAAHAPNFHLDGIEAEHSDHTWVFRWHITAVAADNSPTHPAIYTCVHRDGRAKLREPAYPMEW